MSSVGTPQFVNTATSTDSPPDGAPRARLSQSDAAELAARRAADAKLAARLHGWKPIVLWYTLWAVLLAVGAISSLGSGQPTAGLLGLGFCALSAKYAHYLYNGGRRRVWFVIW
jgi:hypothetical protein